MSSPAGPPPGKSRPVVFLHVGAAKSGTTYLQNVLWDNRRRLREHGVLYPGRDSAAHVRAAFDLRKVFFPGASDPTTRGAWRELVDEARDWDGTVIISQELFAPAAPEVVARALRDLSFAEVHILFTARDLARQIPAHWQEDVKNRFTVTFQEFVSSLGRAQWQSFEVARLFWGLQDAADVLARWSADLPPDRVHVVTLPRPGAPRDLLWRRFCEALGLDPESCDPSKTFANPSLGLAETQFLRRVNTEIDERVPWLVYNNIVKLDLAQQVLTRRPDPLKITMSEADHRWATRRGTRMVETLRTAGYRVVGDLDELIPGPPPKGEWLDPDEPRHAEMLDVSVDAIAALAVHMRDLRDQTRTVPNATESVRDQTARLRADAVVLREITSRMAHDSAPAVKRAVRTLSERYPTVMRLRRAYWRVQETRQSAEGGDRA
ncbi:hypothetical protein [Thermomonospora umbrina]|uniref:hypothetical protein n=1 Tax=Thermomonospora umbrina TaxID=111806 RepID=UPI0011C1B2EF|nr:hypothetical protein [Thermomonospora umbrina]